MRILAALGVTAIVIVVVQDLSGKSDASRFAREERFKVVFGDQPTVGVENLCHQVSAGEYFLPGHLWVTKDVRRAWADCHEVLRYPRIHRKPAGTSDGACCGGTAGTGRVLGHHSLRSRGSGGLLAVSVGRGGRAAYPRFSRR